jgi:cation:H+ antiporter
MGEGFVGTFLVAGSTSLPEVVVSLGAIRLGAVDLAVGNVLGSNLFNILILALDDVAYLPGAIYGAVAPFHLVSAVAVVTMNAILLVGLTYQAVHKRLVLSWDTWGILLVYFLAMILYGTP